MTGVEVHEVTKMPIWAHNIMYSDVGRFEIGTRSEGDKRELIQQIIEEHLEKINVTMTVPEEVIEQAMAEIPKLNPEERIKDPNAEVELGFDEEIARRECERCLRCDVKPD